MKKSQALLFSFLTLNQSQPESRHLIASRNRRPPPFVDTRSREIVKGKNKKAGHEDLEKARGGSDCAWNVRSDTERSGGVKLVIGGRQEGSKRLEVRRGGKNGEPVFGGIRPDWMVESDLVRGRRPAP